MEIKEKRKRNNVSQKQMAKILGVPLRTYIRYENDENRTNTIKYEYISKKIDEIFKVDEEHGILTIENIKEVCKEVFDQHKVDYAYLFGSYSKEIASEKSDIDLLISTSYTGLKYFALLEELKTKLKKNVDLLTVSQLNDNMDLLNEILKDGQKIYG